MPSEQRPWCETCGKDVAEVLCPTCAKWWNDNPPPAQPSGDMVEAAAKAIYGERDFDGLGADVTQTMFAVARAAIAAIQPHIDAARREGFEAGARAMQGAAAGAAMRAVLRASLSKVVWDDVRAIDPTQLGESND